MSDKRKENRLGIRLDVEVQTSDFECSMQTRDLSNSGVFLEKSESHMPTEGDIVQIRIKQNFDGGEPPIVRARVVRVDDDGIALAFISDD